MRRLEIRVYNHQFQNRGVLARIRRKLVRSAAQGECVLLDGEGVEGLSPQGLYALIAGLPEDKIRAIGFVSLRPFPLPLAVR